MRFKAKHKTPIILDRAMFIAAIEAAAERAAQAEYIRQVTNILEADGELGFGRVYVEAPDRLIIIEDFADPHIPNINGRPVIWGSEPIKISERNIPPRDR